VKKRSSSPSLNQNLDHYLKSIPSNVLVEVRELISPLILYEAPGVFIPYPLLLDLFGHNPGDMPLHISTPLSGNPSSKGSSSSSSDLYFALYLSNKAEYNQSFLGTNLFGCG
jgi:hypothetical protein